MKKVRADSWEMAIDRETRDKLFAQLGDLTFAAAKIQAKAVFKIELPNNPNAWYRFLARMRKDEASLMLAKAAATRQEIGDLAKESNISNADIVKSLQTLGATKALSGNMGDMKDLFSVASELSRLENKQEELRIAGEKLKLLQAKEAKLTKTIANDKLSDEERVKKIKSIFGIK